MQSERPFQSHLADCYNNPKSKSFKGTVKNWRIKKKKGTEANLFEKLEEESVSKNCWNGLPRKEREFQTKRMTSKGECQSNCCGNSRHRIQKTWAEISSHWSRTQLDETETQIHHDAGLRLLFGPRDDRKNLCIQKEASSERKARRTGCDPWVSWMTSSLVSRRARGASCQQINGFL